MLRRSIFSALLLGLLTGGSGVLGSAQAATFTVTKTTDTADGTCDADCSLREAVIAANAGAGNDTILVPSGTYTLTIDEAGVDETIGDLDVTQSGAQLTIIGAAGGTIVQAGTDNTNGIDRVFDVESGANLTLSRLTIRYGKVGNFGAGGVANFGGTLTVQNCTLSQNSSLGSGGGIFNNGTLAVLNSTFSQNSAGGGGGISMFGGTATVLNCTLSQNTASGNGGGIAVFGGTMNMGNTIVAGNTSPSGPDIVNTINSLGYNLIGNTSGATITGTTTGNLTGVNPLLDPLNDYGGPTLTYRLQSTSPAIDAGSNALAPTVDQRGAPRPVDGPDGDTVATSDIGAYEFNSTPNGSTLVVNTAADTTPNGCTADDCTLREAITAANSTVGLDTITFNISGAGVHTISPTSALPLITDRVTIDGYSQPGAAEATAGTPATLLIELNGTSAGAGQDGLVLRPGSDGSSIKGLVINRFPDDAIQINSSGNTVTGNYLGTDATGTVDLGNGRNGVRVSDVANNIIGGTTPAARNLISGNDSNGINLGDSSGGGQNIGTKTTGTMVQGNTIGTDITGTDDLGNASDGIYLQQIPGATIGGTAPGAGNLISGNNNNGININLVGSNILVQGNRIGTNATGTAAIGNTNTGVLIDTTTGQSSTNNTIGGTAAGAGNLISGNGGVGVDIRQAGSSNNSVQGNTIGLNAAGDAALGNGSHGVQIFGSPTNTIGGTAAGAGNVISGNAVTGILIIGGGATGNIVAGNTIGTNAAGTTALGNGSHGVQISNGPSNTIGGTTAAARNIISGNVGSGVNISSATATGNLVAGNYIGTNAAGTAALGNDQGVALSNCSGNTIGGTASGAGNVISGNNRNSSSNGVYISGGASSNTIAGNYLGTNAAGDAAVANTYMGVRISNSSNNIIGGTAAAARNIISGNATHGLSIDGTSSNNTIQGNYIGTNVAGTVAIANGNYGVQISASNAVIGGTVAGAGNLISGNGTGILVNPNAANIRIEGNLIGTSAGGSTAVANSIGIRLQGNITSSTIGGTSAGARNVISGNSIGVSAVSGIDTDSQISGNFIGTNATGTLALANGTGIRVDDSTNLLIGGTATGSGNVIANSGNVGVRISGASASIRILGNSIFANALPGIDLNNDGVTANDDDDTDSGPNNRQNFPVLTSVTGGNTINGTLNSTANTTFRIEFFANTVIDNNGYGEGETFLTSTDVTTGASGDVSFTVPFTAVGGKPFITATATNLTTNDTSEFSAALPNNAPINTLPATQTVLEDGSLTFSSTNVPANVISIDDVDAGSSDVKVTLTVTNGTLTLSGVAGLAFTVGDGTADTTMTFTGTITAINAALNGATYTPTPDVNGGATLTITSNDQGNSGYGGVKTDTDGLMINITAVNDAPVLDLSGGSAGIDYSTTFTEGSGSVAAVDSAGLTVTDIDNTSLTGATITLTNRPDAPGEFVLPSTTVPGITANYTPATGVLQLTGTAPLSDYQTLLRSITYENQSSAPTTGPRAITFVVNDGTTSSPVATSTVTVSDANSAPVNTVPGAQTTSEDTDLVFSGARLISINDPDAGNNELQVTLAVTNGTLTLSGTGGLNFTVGDGTGDTTMTFTGTIANINAALDGLTFTPTANVNGNATLTITTNDQGYTGAGGAQTDTDNVTIDVTAVNDAPQLVGIEAGALSYTENAAATPITATLTATDIDDTKLNGATVAITSGYRSGEDVLAFTSTATITGNFNAATGALTLSGAASIAEYQAALRNVTYRNSSENPNAAPRTVSFTLRDNSDPSNTATRTINVVPVNDAPVAQNQNVGTPEDTPLGLTLTATDVDNASLTYSIVALPQHGTLSGTGATRTYTPAKDYNGSDAFIFKANDGALDSNIATVTITVGGANDAPIAANDAATTDKNVPVNISVLANDTDADGDTLRVARVATTVATRGTVAINPDGTLRYAPERNFSGTATFTYTATDGTLESTAIVTVMVRPTNAAPVATADSYSVTTSFLTVAAPGVLGNDTDADDDKLTAEIATNPANGTVTLNADGSFTYTPASGFNGTDTFTYKVSYGTLTSTATVTLKVTAVVVPQPTPTEEPKLILTVVPSTFNENAGPTAAIATLTRNGDIGKAVTVNLVSSDTSEITLPRSVEIPSGATSLRFFIGALDDKVRDGDHDVKIIAEAAGFPQAATTVRVQDNGVVRIPLAIEVKPGGFLESAGRKAAIGTVSIPTPAKADYAITLSSSDESEATVAKTVTIKAGHRSASFYVSAVDDNEADGVQPVTITARRLGFGTATKTLKIGDDDTSALLLTLDSDTVSEGDAVRATVTRNRSLPLSLTVLLTSTAPEVAQVPASVAIPAGETSVSFLVSGVRDGVVGNTRSALITASRAGATSDSATISVVDRGGSARATGAASKVRLSTAVASAAKGTVALTFTGALDAESVLADNFTVFLNGEVVPVEAASYDAGSATVSLLAGGSLKAGDSVHIAWDGLIDTSGGTVGGQTTVAAR